MKIGIRPDTYNRWGDSRFLKMKEHGYSCADYVMVNTKEPIYQCSEEAFQEILLRDKTLAEEAGIEITQLHGPFRMPPKDLEISDRAERMDKMKRSIRAAALLECKYWVIHPLMPYGIEDLQLGKAKETWEINLEFMTELLDYAKSYDVTICLENMSFQQFSMARVEVVYQFVKIMNDSHFKMCLDTGHANVFTGADVGNIVRKYKDEIRTLHIHDNNGKMDLHRFPYHGTIDWKDFYEALLEIDFQGDFSLETEPSWKLPTPIFEKACEVLSAIAADIVGEERI